MISSGLLRLPLFGTIYLTNQGFSPLIVSKSSVSPATAVRLRAEAEWRSWTRPRGGRPAGLCASEGHDATGNASLAEWMNAPVTSFEDNKELPW
jgi:hypothetical protein